MQGSSALIVLAALAAFSAGHPVYHHKFNAIVNSQPCLKQCMNNATADDRELNLLKTSNVTGFLLNLDHICGVISDARECINACSLHPDHNPFTLESVTAICTPETRAEVNALTPCLQKFNADNENGVLTTCREKCGDYESVNDNVHALSKAYEPEVQDAQKEAEVMNKIGEACRILKCSDRCTVDVLNEKCPALESGDEAGALLTAIIDRVLDAQRQDLERLRLVDAMAHSVPSDCSYMYIPGVFLNASRDEEAMSEVIHAAKAEHGLQRHIAGKRHKIMLAHSQLQTRLMQKQVEVLELQAANLKKESEKLDMELELLEKKTGATGRATDEGDEKEESKRSV